MPPLSNNELLAAYRGQFEVDSNEADNPLNHPETETKDTFIARQLGTVLHAAFEQLCRDGLVCWTDKRVEQQGIFWRAQLQQLGISTKDTYAACKRIARLLQLACSDLHSNWIFDNKLQGSACELTLLHKGKALIIDRTFMFNNERWIVDYKSSEPAVGESKAHFLMRESDAYRTQLNRYAEAFMVINNAPVRTYLYFPAIQCLHAVDFSCPKP